MTAFARVETESLTWEIRSVNQRYLDASFRIPDAFRELEPIFRAQLRQEVQRGKVECALRFNQANGELSVPQIDPVQLERISRLIDHLASQAPNLSPVNPLELLNWPGVLKEETQGFEPLLDQAKTLFDEAVKLLIKDREREGAELARVILERLDSLASIVMAVHTEAPAINARLAGRLRDKIAEIAADPDSSRLEQELVYMAQRSDISEELDRLNTHIEEVRSTLLQKGPSGRRLDFLMQELNREANTVSSKATVADTSIQAVELKVIIEQMREQVQNIE